MLARTAACGTASSVQVAPPVPLRLPSVSPCKRQAVCRRVKVVPQATPVVALLSSLQNHLSRLPPPLLLLLAKVSAATQTRLTANQLRLLCTAWHQASSTSPQQDVALLSCLACIQPEQQTSSSTSSARRAQASTNSYVPEWWQQDVYARVGQAALQLSAPELIRFLEAACELGGLQPQTCAQIVQALSRSTGEGGLFGGLTPEDGAKLLILSRKLGTAPAIPVLNALVSKLEANVQSLDPVLFLQALQAAAGLSYDLELSQLALACRNAQPMMSSLPSHRVVACLAAASQCASQMPTVMLQITTPTASSNQAGAAAVTALRQLVLAACQALAPSLSQLPPAQLVSVSQALQQCRYTELLPSDRAGVMGLGVGVGAGQGQQGDAMVNSFPVTVIHPSSYHPATSTPGSANTSGLDQAATAAASGSVLPSAASSTSSQQGSSVSGVVRDSDGAGAHDSQAFLQGLHAAYMQQIGAFQDADQLADVVRPLARLRALPARSLLTSLADKVVASGQQGGTAAMSDHAMCMSLFLFSMLGYRPGAQVLQAAQAQLSGPAMLSLSPGDLTSAIWAFACLAAYPDSPPSGTGSRAQARSSASPDASTSATAGTQAAAEGQAGSGKVRSRTLADIAAANTANASRQSNSSRSASTGMPSTQGVMGPGGQRTAPAPAWFNPAMSALQVQLAEGKLAPYQIAFILGSLERTKTRLSPAMIDLMLASFRAQLSVAGTGDVVLLLASVARLGHVTTYSWMEAVVESWMLTRLPGCTPKELATLAWALASLHHRPPMEFLTALVDAAEVRLSSFTPDNLCTLVWSVAQLDADAPITLFLDSMCTETQQRLPSFNPRDLVALLGALATLKYQPSPEWLSDWFRAADCHLRYIDSQGLSQMISALSVLDTKVSSNSLWGRIIHRVEKSLVEMDGDSLLAVAAGLSYMQFNPSSEWSQAFTRAVDRLCTSSAPTWGRPAAAGTANDVPPINGTDDGCLSAAQHELMLGAQLKLGIAPSSQQMQHLEQQLSGLSAIRGLGADRLLRLVGALAAVITRWGMGAPAPRAAWLGGPLAEALRGALPDMTLVQQSQLARLLGDLITGLDARASWHKANGTRSSSVESEAEQQTVGRDQLNAAADAPSGLEATEEPAPASLKNLAAYLKEFFLFGGKS